jgi:hypothetical protein
MQNKMKIIFRDIVCKGENWINLVVAQWKAWKIVF